MQSEVQYIRSGNNFLTSANTRMFLVINQPEKEEDGPTIVDSIYVVVVVHVGFDGIDEARVQLLSLVKDEQGLSAA